MLDAIASTPAAVRSDKPLTWAYALLMLAIALLQSVPALQDYRARGGQHDWEPVLWEFSSAICTGLLALVVYRWHVAGLRRPGIVRQIGRHALGAAAFVLAHVGGMFALRFAVYAVTSVSYDPGSASHILRYEAGKDFAAYLLIVAISHGLWHYVEGQRRQQELARLRGELAEARLSRLAEQIQPHFLFNTLNLISSVMYEDVAKADRILCDLAQLLRQALAAQQLGSHTVAQEMDLVEPYLAIMRARFGEDRLQVRIEVSEAAKSCQVPALLLISPVENAIKHDVALTRGPVEIVLCARLANDELQVTVSNSGTAPERTQRDGAIGLVNTRERLLSLFGKRASVELQAGPDGGSLLRISLPAASTEARA